MSRAPDRLSICYLVPGHHLLPSSGPTRNVLSLATALAPEADITVAFRKRLDEDDFDAVPVRELDRSGRPPPAPVVDDAALRGVGYRDFFTYLRALRRFVRATAGDFDVVLEKSWLLSGYLSGLYGRLGIPAIAVENLIPAMSSVGRTDPATRARHAVAGRIAGRGLGRVPRIIVETETLRRALAARWSLDPDHIDVVPLGVDVERFAPRDRDSARRRLGVPGDELVLVYVGVLDRTHDLAPVLEALAAADAPRARLHLVGDGALRGAYEERAARLGIADRVHFRGRVPHSEVPAHVAAADLCLAPYDPCVFHDGEVPYATLKIRECLAAGRPVASVRSGSIPDLIEHGSNGFLVEHGDPGWRELVASLPGRDALHAMGESAAARPARSWDEVAGDYLDVCRRVVAAARSPESVA